MTDPQRTVLSSVTAGRRFCDIFGIDSKTVTRILIQMQIGEPMFAHVTHLINNEEVDQMFVFLETLERLDPINTENPA